MSRVVELLRSRRVPQVAVLALMSVGFAGCSADTQTRFSQDSFSNPFNYQPEATGSVQRRQRRQVERRELPQYARPQTPPQSQYQSSALPPPPVVTRRDPIRSPATACPAEGAGLSSYTPPAPAAARDHRHASRRARSRHASPAQAAPRSSSAPATRSKSWRKRYNVSTAAILQANGYKGPRALSPGQQLIIPRQTVCRRTRAGSRAAGQQAGRGRGRAVERSRRQSRRYADEHRAPQPCPGGRARQGQQPRHVGQAQPRHEAHRARREERCRRAGGAARRARAAGRRGRCARRQAGHARSAAAKRAPGAADRQCRGKAGAPKRRRSSPAKPPARCRPSAGRCAAR